MDRKYDCMYIEWFFVMNVIFVLQLLFGMSLCKRISWYCYIGILFIGMDYAVATFFGSESEVSFFAVYGYIVLCAILLSKGQRFRLVLFTVPAILLLIQWDSILELFDRIFLLQKYSITLEGKECAPFYIFSDILIFVVLIFVLSYCMKKSKRLQLTIKEAIFLSCFCIFSTMIIAVFDMFESTFQNYLYSLTWMSFVVIINVAIFYGILYHNYAKKYKMLSENFMEQFNSAYSYFKDYKEQQKEVIKFRHDYHNHMLLLSSMLEKGEYDRAKAYFTELSLSGGGIGKKYITGNEIVDIILNAKQEQLEEASIEIECNGGLEPLQVLEDVDCCILFSNLIDNAIEANRKCNQKHHITIKSTREHSLYMVEISNGTDKTMEKQENLLKTYKDGSHHGIGTKNAFAIIGKYQGEYKVFIREQDFVIQMVFPIDRLS